MECLTENRNRFSWAMYDGQLIIYPKAGTSSVVEATGILAPPSYTELDLKKEMVKEIEAGQEAVEVQGLSDAQLKLVRYRVLARLFEDVSNFEVADRMEAKANRIERELQINHSDNNYTDSDSMVRPSNV